MPSIYHTVFIGASAQTVYDAISTQQGLASWWTPETIAAPRLNDTARFNFGAHYFKEMKITTLEPLQQLTWLCTAGAAEWVSTGISFRLLFGEKKVLLNEHPELAGQLEQYVGPEGTVLIFEHSNWAAQTPMFAECNYTWALFLRSLKLYCETGTGHPWPNQHSS